jgi:uncharacterized protein
MMPGPPMITPDYVVKLTEANKVETLRFLASRPIHTVFMASLISDNGVTSPYNRGVFYGYRNGAGPLEGVALIGHATLVETESQECIEAFAHIARRCSPTHLIRGEQDKVASFWNYYSDHDHNARLMCREFLLRRQASPRTVAEVPGLRQATLADLEVIVAVNASLASAENGTNPLAKDSSGFRERVARRIRQGRSWVLIEDRQLIFKTDIVAETPQAAYIEGVYVTPEKRGQGYGFNCVSRLSEHLLQRTGAICLTVNERFTEALTFYTRVGFVIDSRYDTIYLVN